MEKHAKIFVAGHRGLVGSAILNSLQRRGYDNFLLRTHGELDLTVQADVDDLFQKEQPEYVFLSAAYVGGIMANLHYRADFIWRNLMIESNVIRASWQHHVKKLLFLGSTCIYPKEAPQPMTEDCLLTSPLEYTNEPYAIAKIAGIRMCESYNLQYGTNYIAVMPTNLYGPRDNFDLVTSHVLPAMVRKIHLAKCLSEQDEPALRLDLNRRPVAGVDGRAPMEKIASVLHEFGIEFDKVKLWGTGKPLREFLWSEEMADASVYVMERVDFRDLCPKSGEIRNTQINIGTGKEMTISEVAELIRKKIGYGGKIEFDPSKPDGTMRKLTDVSRIHSLGWHHHIEIEEGIERLYKWYLTNER